MLVLSRNARRAGALVLVGYFNCAIATGGSESSPAPEFKHLADFSIPKQFRSDPLFHPAEYLESYPVKDTTVVLGPEQRERLLRLFVAAHDACVAKYHQSFFIATKSPIYQLLVRNDARVAALPPQEGGNVMYLGAIVSEVRPARPRAPSSKRAR